MVLGNFITKWSIRGIARTQFRLFRLTQEKSPGVPECLIAPQIFQRRMNKILSSDAQKERIKIYLGEKGSPKTLRQACYAIAIVEFKINPLDEDNVTFMTGILDKELQSLGYTEEEHKIREKH